MSGAPRAHRVALLGTPASGKSTYLSALIDGLDAGLLPHLQQGPAPSDARALFQLAEPLREGRYPVRTPAGAQPEVALTLRTTGAVLPAGELTLVAQDYSGEEIDRLFHHRHGGWSPAWRARARAEHLLLFLRLPALPPEREPPPCAATDPWQALRAVTAEERPAPAGVSGPEAHYGPGLQEELPRPPVAAPGDAVLLHHALELIELLQFIREARGLAAGERPAEGALRLALCLSAWDALDAEWQHRGPQAFLRRAAPLLCDFLWSNFAAADVFSFGLSTTGGDLNNAAHRARYQKEPGGYVVFEGARGQLLRADDIGVPLYWTLFGDAPLRLGTSAPR